MGDFEPHAVKFYADNPEHMSWFFIVQPSVQSSLKFNFVNLNFKAQKYFLMQKIK